MAPTGKRETMSPGEARGTGRGRGKTSRQDGAARGGSRSVATVEQGTRDQFGQGTGQAMIELDFLRGLIEAVDQSGIDSLEINRAGTRIRISKTAPAAPVTHAPIAQASGPTALPAALHAAGVAQGTDRKSVV